ncbi:MAG: hypothetical protein ACJAYC_001366 [Halieaceae bacterium]|jgi:hypothetical protein
MSNAQKAKESLFKARRADRTVEQARKKSGKNKKPGLSRHPDK